MANLFSMTSQQIARSYDSYCDREWERICDAEDAALAEREEEIEELEEQAEEIFDSLLYCSEEEFTNKFEQLYDIRKQLERL